MMPRHWFQFLVLVCGSLSSVPANAQQAVVPKSWAEVFEVQKNYPSKASALPTPGEAYSNCRAVEKPDSLLLTTTPRTPEIVGSLWWPGTGQTLADALLIKMPAANDTITVKLADTWCSYRGMSLLVERKNTYLLISVSSAAVIIGKDPISRRTYIKVADRQNYGEQLSIVSTESRGEALLPLAIAQRWEAARLAAIDSQRADSAERAKEGVRKEKEAQDRLAANRVQAESTRAAEKEQRIETAYKQAMLKDSLKEARIQKKGWPARFRKQVMEGTVTVGMDAEMVREAWGEPDDINRTVTASTVSEQWVFRFNQNYVYLENGRVTAIQD